MVLPGTDLIVIWWIVNIFSTLLIANRLYVRIERRRGRYHSCLWLGPSDWLVLAALFFPFAETALNMPIYLKGDLKDGPYIIEHYPKVSDP